MTARALRSLSELRAGIPLGQVEVGGRVVLASAQGFRLSRDALTCDIAWARPPPLGALVRVTGDWNGTHLDATRVVSSSAPRRDPMRADAEFAWGQSGGIAALEQRHRALRALRGCFDREGFVEVETPSIVRSPGLELHLDALEVLGEGERRWLTTSPEYHMKRLLAAGMTRIYQLGRAYRKGEQGALHQPEFSMLEWYRAFSGSDHVMQDTERLVAEVALALHGRTRLPGLRGELDVTPPWERLTVREAFVRYAGRSADELLVDEDAFYRVLIERVEPELGLGRPVFLTDYPAQMAALARLQPHDPTSADRFEAYADGVELCNGFGELVDPAEQRRRFEADRSRRRAAQRPVYPIDERFLAALEDGLPECSGNALGVDRLLMLALGKQSIDEVVAFSTERG